jgi:hypothetical protein
MLELKAAQFLAAVNALALASGVVEGAEGIAQAQSPQMDATKMEVKQDAKMQLLALCSVLKTHLIDLGCVISIQAVEDLERTLRQSKVNYRQIADGHSDVSRTLQREMQQTTLLILSSQERLMYAPADLAFGSKFNSGFSTAGAFELDEAMKCMALGRPTAAVFHLMRVMEVGIRAMASCLGIPDPVKPAERNWAIILGKIMDGGIKMKWPSASNRMNGEAALFEELHASLDAVKNPFRNATMHVETKYTDAEAQHIFALVKGFMMKLADRMDESGSPKVP